MGRRSTLYSNEKRWDMMAELANGEAPKVVAHKYDVPVSAVYSLLKRHFRKKKLILVKPSGATVDIQKPREEPHRKHFEASGFITPPSRERLMARR